MKHEHDDPYCYPGTSVLKNLAGHQDQASLDAFEAKVVAFNLVKLYQTPITRPFDIERLKETHGRIFNSVYPWAGQFREHTGWMTKHRHGDAITYADSAYIEQELRKVFASLTGEHYLQDLDAGPFARRAAHYYGELDAIHPFREGNSRTLRQFMADLALQAGHRLEWAKVAENEESRQRLYLARDTAVMDADPTRLAAIIKTALSPIHRLENKTSDRMKQRLLVMNGQRIVQTQQDGEWLNQKVDHARALKPGIYHLYMAQAADKSKRYDGMVVHTSDTHVYQQVGKNFVMHARSDFDKTPEIGSVKSITYAEGRAVVAAATLKLGRGHSR